MNVRMIAVISYFQFVAVSFLKDLWFRFGFEIAMNMTGNNRKSHFTL